MLKRLFQSLLVVLGLLIVGLFALGPKMADERYNRVVGLGETPEIGSEVALLHKSLLVADLHADLLLWDRDPLDLHDYGHVDLPRLAEGNVGIQTFGVVTKSPTGQNYETNEGSSDRITPLVVFQMWPTRTWRSLFERARFQADRLASAVRRSDGQLVALRSREDVDELLKRRANGEPAVGALLALEGMHAIEGDLDKLDELFESGFRMMATTHFFDNGISGSAHGTRRYGLTQLGTMAIRRMEELGIIVDLAHVSPAAIDDILEIATKPVVVSHTGVKATCDSRRNISDEHIRAVASTGGVIGIGYWAGAVCGTELDDIARAIRHAVAVAGVDHVGLGSDYDGSVATGFDTTKLVYLTDRLRRDGFSDADVQKIMGGNVARVYREVLPSR